VEKLEQIEALLAGYRQQGLDFHALRTRQSGSRTFVVLHVLVPGNWTVQEGHTWAERIEVEIHHFLPRAHVTTHLEPLEDPVSMTTKSLIDPGSDQSQGWVQRSPSLQIHLPDLYSAGSSRWAQDGVRRQPAKS
jgi:hypothetical protein